MDQRDGRFLQISGFSYKFDSSKPAGQKVIRDSFKLKNGKEFNLDQKYSIAVVAYMGRLGKDGYTMFADKDKATHLNDEDCDKTILDIVLMYLK